MSLQESGQLATPWRLGRGHEIFFRMKSPNRVFLFWRSLLNRDPTQCGFNPRTAIPLVRDNGC